MLRMTYLIPLFIPLAIYERNAARFSIQWLPFYAVIVMYDLFRGIADDLGHRVEFDLLIQSERWFFGGHLPVVWLQDHIGGLLVGWQGTILSVFYFGHFLLPVAVCYVFWRSNLKAFYLTMSSIVLLSLLGFVTFYFFPSAPPWMAAETGKIPHVDHILLFHLRSVSPRDYLSSWYILFNSNKVAAFPSLHAGYPLLLWLCIRQMAPRYQWIFLINCIVAAFTVVAFGEHYFVDVLAGWLYASFSFFIVKVCSKAVTGL